MDIESVDAMEEGVVYVMSGVGQDIVDMVAERSKIFVLSGLRGGIASILTKRNLRASRSSDSSRRQRKKATPERKREPEDDVLSSDSPGYDSAGNEDEEDDNDNDNYSDEDDEGNDNDSDEDNEGNDDGDDDDDDGDYDDGEPMAKRRKVQKSIEDFRTQAAQMDFSAKDVDLFEQDHHRLGDEVPHSSDVAVICQTGSSTQWWARNSRKMSARNVKDKLARKRREPYPEETDPEDRPAPLTEAATAAESSAAEPADRQAKSVSLVGPSSHLYKPKGRPVAPTTLEIVRSRRDPRETMAMAGDDINRVISSIIAPHDSRTSMLVRFLLYTSQPRRQQNICVVMEDKDTGARQEIVRTVPYYRESLGETASSPWGQPTTTTAEPPGSTVPNVHAHSRAWEEAWLLRTPIVEWGERACVMGEKCEGMSPTFDARGVLREYVSPKEHAQWMAFGVWPHLSLGCRQCLMCKRKVVGNSYWSSRGAVRSANPNSQMLIDFYNIVDIPGEYYIGQCLWNNGPYMGFWGPVVRHQLRYYTAVRTTVGELIGRGVLVPRATSSSFAGGSDRTGVGEALLQRSEVICFNQTGLVRIDQNGINGGGKNSAGAYGADSLHQVFYRGLSQ